MSTNPFYNAILALLYIIVIVSFVTYVPDALGLPEEDNVFMPMTMLGLLVLSVAVMAYLFFYRPVVMLLDGEREKAVKLFLKTVGIFAVGVVLVFAASALVG